MSSVSGLKHALRLALALACLCLLAAVGVYEKAPALAAQIPGGPAEAPAEILRRSTRLPARPARPPQSPAVAAPAVPEVSTPKTPATQPVPPAGDVRPTNRPAMESGLEAAPKPAPGAAADAAPETAVDSEKETDSTPDAARKADPEKGQDDDSAARQETPAASGSVKRPPPAVSPGFNEQDLQRRGIALIEVRPARPYMLSLPFPGTLAEVAVHDGEIVEKDQELAVLDTGQARRELEEARQAMTKALERVQAMQEFAAKQQEEAREYLAGAADKLREAEERMSMTILRAPFAGRVTEVKAHAGQHLRRGEPVMELAEKDDIEVIGDVPSAWVSSLKRGHIIWVFVEETGKSYEAEFMRFGGKVNPSIKSIRAYSRFLAPPEELLPGMSGRADYFPPRSR